MLTDTPLGSVQYAREETPMPSIAHLLYVDVLTSKDFAEQIIDHHLRRMLAVHGLAREVDLHHSIRNLVATVLKLTLSLYPSTVLLAQNGVWLSLHDAQKFGTMNHGFENFLLNLVVHEWGVAMIADNHPRVVARGCRIGIAFHEAYVIATFGNNQT